MVYYFISYFIFRSVVGGKSESDCSLCDDGKFCEGLNNTQPTGDCNPGYWCKRGNKSPTPSESAQGGLCPASKYCKGQTSVPENCEDGKIFLFYL